ncbi:DUF6263 family protein [Roseivirga pacifica]|uniref:DUF6263 family protein n=1 Tax=Roseivirga pacifica TaxID=1267423 RepID=UPI00227CA870|nr:DUF6263 family protein [Roseivirga pacifica]
MKLIMTLLVGALTLLPTAKPKIDGYNFKKGEKYELNVIMAQSITQSVMGQEMLTKMNMETTELLEVVDVSGDVFTIKVTGKRRFLKMNMPNGMGETIMNSEGSEAIDKPFSIMVNKSYSMKMNRQGKVLELIGVDEMVEAMEKELAGTQFAAQSGELLAIYSEDNLKTTMNTQFEIYPEDGKREWGIHNVTVVSNIPVDVSMDMSFKDDQTIYGEGTISMDGDISAMGMNMKAKMNGTQQSIFDLASNGVPTKAQTIQEVSGNLDAMGQKIPMTINTEATTTYVKL